MKNIPSHFSKTKICDSEDRITHGKTSSYDKGCRCDLCKKAKSDFRKNCPIRKHGTKWSYDKGCRCDLCKEAKSAYWHKKHPDTKKPDTTNVIDQTRRCHGCGVVKPLTEYGVHTGRLLNLSYECKECHRSRCRGNKNKPWQRYSTYKSSANVRDIPFLLSFEEFNEYWNKPCYYCGDEIQGIGLDRIDSEGPYSIENIRPCCALCNKAKLVLSEEAFISMCLKIARRFDSRIADLSS